MGLIWVTFRFKKYPPLDRGQLRRLAVQQRQTVLGGMVVYAVAALAIRALTPEAGLGGGAFAPAVSLAALYVLGFLQAPVAQFLVIPVFAAAMFGVEIVLAATAAPGIGAVGFALAFGIAALFVAVLAGAAPYGLAALGILAAVMVYGGLIHLPMLGLGFSPIIALVCGAPFLLGAAVLVRRFQASEAAAVVLRQELERRATSDGLTGVANRAHITLLAQNEFTRARRYSEPHACLMIEIDDYAAVLVKHGARAMDTIVQVLSGYCVVVMRHCDSFGRLTPARFLALLPETVGNGAVTLANRMCRDTAALDVAFDGQRLKFTISIGAAEIHLLDRWSGDLLRRAEQALDDAIEQGRNCAVLGVQTLLPPDEEDDPRDAPGETMSPPIDGELKTGGELKPG